MVVMALDLLHCNWMARRDARREMVDWASAIIIIYTYFTFLLQLAEPVEKLLLSNQCTSEEPLWAKDLILNLDHMIFM